MSEFLCPVVRVSIEPHPNADAIELAVVGGYLSVVPKGQFQTGDLAVYIPEQAILPESLLKKLGFWDELTNKGTLSGSAGNRVKALRLRGVLSQGVLVQIEPNSATEGDDRSEILGITKYEQAIPIHMSGLVVGCDIESTLNFDVENIKSRMDLFDDGEYVAITEKLHGTFVQFGVIPDALCQEKTWSSKVASIRGFKPVVSSKGMGGKGLMLNVTDKTNLYVKMGHDLDIWNKMIDIVETREESSPIFILGEILGQGIQDLTYGQTKPIFRVFDIYVGTRHNGRFMNFLDLVMTAADARLDMVPVEYIGPFSMDVVRTFTDGPTTLSKVHIREGVVVKTATETRHDYHGRKIAKSISDKYLLRKNATEFN